MLVGLGEMDESLNNNIATVKEFEIFHNCADERAYVDQGYMYNTNVKLIEQVEFHTGATIAGFVFMGLECCLVCSIFCCTVIKEFGRNITPRLKLHKEILYIIELLRHG